MRTRFVTELGGQRAGQQGGRLHHALGDLLDLECLIGGGPLGASPNAVGGRLAASDLVSQPLVAAAISLHKPVERSESGFLHGTHMRHTNNLRQDGYAWKPLFGAARLGENMRMAQKPRIGHFLREWRRFRGLSMEAACEAAAAIVQDRVIAEGEEGSLARIGLSQPNLSRIETGKTPYNQTLLEVLAEVYQTDIPSLIMRNPEEPESIWSIYDQLPASEKPVALKVLRGLKKTGTDG